MSKDYTLWKKKVHSTEIEPTSLWFGTYSFTDWASGGLFEVVALLLMVYSYMENLN
jgi:hypothetical protein